MADAEDAEDEAVVEALWSAESERRALELCAARRLRWPGSTHLLQRIDEGRS